MRAIVTGGAGFIGSHLVDALVLGGHEVIVLDNLSTGRAENLSHIAHLIRIEKCDLSMAGDWRIFFKDCDWVFHLAALADIVPSIQNPEAYFKSNVDATFNVLQACQGAGIKKLVYTASSSCYGIPDEYPTSETADIRPQYPYAMTKRIGEELILHWAQIYKLPAVSLRFFNVYGPRSRTSGTYGAVFGVFLAQKLAGKPLTIVGDGLQTRDFTYVTDVIEAIMTAVHSKQTGQIYNVGSGKSVSINYLAGLLSAATINIPKRPGEPDCTFADIAKIRSELNWSPKISIEDGVAEILKSIDYWSDAPVWTPDSIKSATEDWFKYLS
jgi:UDP-glucose 4-epimerase